MVTSLRDVGGARPGDDRRERRRGVPRRLAAGARLGRPGDAGPDRPRGRADRRRLGRTGEGDPARATGTPSTRPPRRCSSTRRSPASRSTPCCRPVEPTLLDFTAARGGSPRGAGRSTSRRRTVSKRATAGDRGRALALVGRSHRPRLRAADPIWRLEQPPPPPGVPVQGARSGRLATSSSGPPTAACCRSKATPRSPRGIFSWDGQSWHQLATVCGGPGDTARIAWAGPTEFWVISAPSPPRAGHGAGAVPLQGRRGGRLLEHPDRRRRPVPADDVRPPAMGRTTAGSAASARRTRSGERVGAFHLHWDGARLTTVYGPQGRGVSDMQFHQGALFESTLVGRSPENRADPVDLAEPEPVPRLIHRIAGSAFANDPFEPAPLPECPVDGTELLALDSDGADLWAVGGGAASGPSAPPDGAVARPPRGGSARRRRLPAAVPERRRLRRRATASSTSPRSRARTEALATVVPVRRSAERQQQGDGGAGSQPTGRHDRHPAARRGRRPRQRRADRLPGARTNAGWSPGPAGSSTTATAPRLPRDTDPAFAGTIEFRPNESAEQFVPDRPPADDSQLFAPPPLELTPNATKPREGEAPAAAAAEGQDSRLQRAAPDRQLHVTRKARVQLLAKRGGRTVARTPRKLLRPRSPQRSA